MIDNNCTNKTDEELILLTLENSDFYICIVQRYEDKISRYIRRISSASEQDTEDILQDVFISAYKNLNNFDYSFKFSSWLYRIAHNKTISFWRRLKSRPQIAISNDDVDLFSFISDGSDLLEDIANKHDIAQIKIIINSLDIKYRDVLILKFIEEKNYKEISDILKKPMGTVATLLNRAKKQLKRKLQSKKFINFNIL